VSRVSPSTPRAGSPHPQLLGDGVNGILLREAGVQYEYSSRGSVAAHISLDDTLTEDIVLLFGSWTFKRLSDDFA
jgi:hypothetical protein